MYALILLIGLILHSAIFYFFAPETMRAGVLFLGPKAIFLMGFVTGVVALAQYFVRKKQHNSIIKYDINTRVVTGANVFLIMILLGFIFYTFTQNLQKQEPIRWIFVFYGAIFIFLAASFEEIVFRGYFYRRWMQKTRRSRFSILLLQAGLFAMVHIHNPDNNWVRLVNIFLIGIVLGISAMKNLKTAILYHFLWNLFSGVVFGIPVSGIKIKHVIAASSIATWESSLVLLFVLIPAAFILLWSMKRNSYEA